MGLILPRGPSWNFCSHNLSVGDLSLTDIGTSVTAGANDADAAAVGVLAALAHDVEYLVLGFQDFDQSGADSSSLLDLLFDPAGGTSWQSLIDDLMVGYTTQYDQFGGAPPRWYHFPVFIPAGSAVGARARTARASDITTGTIIIFAYGGNANPDSWWCGQSVTAVGVVPTESRGTLVTSGASMAYGSWVDIGSPIPRDCGALQFVVQGQATATGVAAGFQFEFGVGESPIGPPIYGLNTTSETGLATPTGLIFKSLPAGTQLQARGANTTAGAVDFDVAAYAVH